MAAIPERGPRERALHQGDLWRPGAQGRGRGGPQQEGEERGEGRQGRHGQGAHASQALRPRATPAGGQSSPPQLLPDGAFFVGATRGQGRGLEGQHQRQGHQGRRKRRQIGVLEKGREVREPFLSVCFVPSAFSFSPVLLPFAHAQTKRERAQGNTKGLKGKESRGGKRSKCRTVALYYRCCNPLRGRKSLYWSLSHIRNERRFVEWKETGYKITIFLS